MAPDDIRPKWGTIYLDASREATLDKLDAMQAATRQEQWNQRTQNEYLERVREKAAERAREILGAAYVERQRVLEDAAEEARHIRQEAATMRASAQNALTEAETIRHMARDELEAAKARLAASKEEGFQAGLERAQEELARFRTELGMSLVEVLRAIHGQCGVIFEGWRKELTELLKVCVEKSTALVLDERHGLVLEHLIMEAVRQLDDRRCITLRVHPDDENAVAGIFAAAGERLPNMGQWSVAGDPSLELGGLVAESQSGTVDSRLELHSELVMNILRHLTLPSTELDSLSMLALEEVVRRETENIAALTPPAVEETAADPAPEAETRAGPAETYADPQPDAHDVEVSQNAFADENTEEHRVAEEEPHPLSAEEGAALWPSDKPEPLSVEEGNPPHEPTRRELEEELLPLPEDAPEFNPPHVDAVLAQGGFLDCPDEAENQERRA